MPFSTGKNSLDSLFKEVRVFKACVCGGHLQNGKQVRRKKPGKMGKKMEIGPLPEIAEKWPPKWKNGRQNGIVAIFSPFFSISVAIFRPFQTGGHFPFPFPFSPDFCAGPVSYSVDFHRTRNSRRSPTVFFASAV